MCNAPEEDVKTMTLTLALALAFVDVALLAGVLVPAAVVVAAILLLGQLASAPLPT